MNCSIYCKKKKKKEDKKYNANKMVTGHTLYSMVNVPRND